MVQYNKVGLIDETKNGKSMGLYRIPRIRLIRVKIGLLEETKNEVDIIEHWSSRENQKQRIEP